ncbi:restriction endonuclease subunit S [Desulfonatronospira sp.]|uniref:restriction endonuclease subunit S n=1 Tax=Desulfonatronospira sp. TaxID=1962951 RepID=UPI0025BC6E50|nr:restriction endonuclease subunit S [Desulfonatronospira sp.]
MKWPSVPLDNISVTIRNGLNIRQSSIADGLPITRIETISEQVINPQLVGYGGIKEGEKKEWYLKENDILFGHINSEERIGNCAMYNGFPKPLVHGMNLLCLRPNVQLIDPSFLLYSLRSNFFKIQLKSIIKRAVNQASVSIGNLKEIKIPLPPFSEQRRIVEILDQADHLRKMRIEADKKAERILPALFIKMFGDPVLNPLRLPTDAVGDLLILLRNGTTAAQNQNGQGYPVSRIETISAGIINPQHVRYVELDDEARDRWMLQYGDILFSHINSESHIGKTAIYKGQPPCLIHGMNLLLIRSDQNKVLPEYLFAILNTESVRTAYRQRCKRAVNQASLNQKDISTLEVAVAPLDAQSQFCKIANSLLGQLELQKQSTENIDSLFDNLLHRAFSGDLTASWRQANMKELLQEMEIQAKALAS